MINGVHHTAISTPDIARLVAFYCDLFGFETVYETDMKASARVDAMLGVSGAEARIVMMRTGTSFLELFQFSAPTPATQSPDRPVVDHGFTHICVNVVDIHAEYSRLKEGGMRFHSLPLDNGPVLCAYGRDPDGNVIELIEVIDDTFAFHFDRRALSAAAVAGIA